MFSLEKTYREVKTSIGESPICVGDSLYWVDADGQRVFRLDLATESIQTFVVNIPVTAIAVTSHGDFILASKTGLYRCAAGFDDFELLCDPEAQRPECCINDAVVAPNGDLWFGSMNEQELSKPDGRLYIWQAENRGLLTLDSGFSVANGIAFDPVMRFAYVANMFKGEVIRYRLGHDGRSFTGKSVFIRLAEDEGLPDGLLVDKSGNLIICHWQAARFSLFNPQGEQLSSQYLPARHITRACFSDRESGKIFVTSGHYGMDAGEQENYPDSGYLFACRSQCEGQPTYPYLDVPQPALTANRVQ